MRALLVAATAVLVATPAFAVGWVLHQPAPPRVVVRDVRIQKNWSAERVQRAMSDLPVIADNRAQVGLTTWAQKTLAPPADKETQQPPWGIDLYVPVTAATGPKS